MKQAAEKTIQVQEINVQSLEVCVIGQTPFIYHAMSFKAKGTLILPRKKTTAEKATSLKHDPVTEFRDTTYQTDGDSGTRLYIPPAMFKMAMAHAALDAPGAKKSEIGRLVWIPEAQIPMYGDPRLFMAITRSSDINGTPDVRTRAILPQWAAKFTIQYVVGKVNRQTLVNLLTMAGLCCGIGDWRQQKGSGNYGQFRLTGPDDPSFQKLLRESNTYTQDQALDAAIPYDKESDKLLTWYQAEIESRYGDDKPGKNPLSRRLETVGAA